MDKDKCCSTKLSVCNFGMAVGIVWGLTLFVCALLAMMFGLGVPFIDLFSSVYIGFDSTPMGAVFGLIWGFVKGFIVGALVAFFYDFCARRCPCSSCKKDRKCCK